MMSKQKVNSTLVVLKSNNSEWNNNGTITKDIENTIKKHDNHTVYKDIFRVVEDILVENISETLNNKDEILQDIILSTPMKETIQIYHLLTNKFNPINASSIKITKNKKNFINKNNVTSIQKGRTSKILPSSKSITSPSSILKKEINKRKNMNETSSSSIRRIFNCTKRETIYNITTLCMPLFSLPNNNNYIVPKYKLHTCTVGGKNISSYVSLIFCYLLNQKKYQTVLKYFDDIKGAMNPCHKINGPFTIKSVIKNYGKNSSDFWGEWKHLVIIKNPIDRFLDNFIDLCSNSSDKIKKSDCFNCNSSDMKCFLEKLYKDINKVMKNKKKIPNKRIKNYFYPQTSHCDYTLNHESIRYLNISLPYYQFSKQLINIIESSRVPKKDLTLIEKDISQKMEKHLLNNNGIERKLHEKTLYNDNYLLDLVTKIYYQDFVAFNYQLPSFT